MSPTHRFLSGYGLIRADEVASASGFSPCDFPDRELDVEIQPAEVGFGIQVESGQRVSKTDTDLAASR